MPMAYVPRNMSVCAAGAGAGGGAGADAPVVLVWFVVVVVVVVGGAGPARGREGVAMMKRKIRTKKKKKGDSPGVETGMGAVDGRNENAVSASPKLTIMSAVSGRWSVVGIMPNVLSQKAKPIY